MITQHKEMIGHREDQITENDTLLNQRNIVIEYLQEQVQDLTLELDDANAYIEFLQVPPVPPEIPEPPAGNEEEDPEEIEGVSELDSEHEGLEPEAQNSDPSLGSESSVGNLDDLQNVNTFGPNSLGSRTMYIESDVRQSGGKPTCCNISIAMTVT